MQTVKNLIEEWFYGYERNLIKPSSAACYHTHIYKHIIPELGAYKPSELSHIILQSYFSMLSENGLVGKAGGLSGKTVRDNHMILNNFLNYLELKNIVTKNICSNIRLPKDYKRPARVLSREEQHKVEEAVKQSSNDNSYGIILCLYTGIRIGELCGLHMDDVDLPHQLLHIRGTVQRIRNLGNEKTATSIIYGTPKSTSSIRDIPLSDPICALLKRKMRIEEFKGKRMTMLASKNGGFVEPRVYQKHFQHIIKVADIPATNFHALRHTFATRALEAGMDYKTLSELLGHSSPAITLKTYAHSLLEEKRKAMNLVGRLYEG